MRYFDELTKALLSNPQIKYAIVTMLFTLLTILYSREGGGLHVNIDILRGRGSEVNKFPFTHQHQWIEINLNKVKTDTTEF